MISSLHDLYDDRIYWKEALSLKRAGYEVVHIGTGEDNTDELSEHGIRLIRVKRKRYFRQPYLDIVFRRLTFQTGPYKKILALCMTLQADVYHFHDIQINRIGRRLVRLPHAPRVIYDAHEDYADLLVSHHPNRGLMRLFIRIYAAWLDHWEKSCTMHYDCLIAAVSHIYNKFDFMANRGRAIILHNYTALQPLSFKPYAQKKYDAIYSGQINAVRGAMQILEAVNLLKNDLPHIRVLLLGPVPDYRFKQQLEQYIARHQLERHIDLHDPVAYQDVETYYQDSRIGLGIFMPVSIFYYGLQIKTFEYMAFGLPVVCSNFGSIRDIVSNTHCGITVDPHSPEDIRQALLELLTNRDLYAVLGRNGMEAVKSTYHWKAEEVKLLGLYERLLRKRNTGD
jgi:glycosyltransferase involved in cell wall biosynthesis